MNAPQELPYYPMRIQALPKGRADYKKTQSKRNFSKPTYVGRIEIQRFRVVPTTHANYARAPDRAPMKLAPFILSDALCRKVLESSLSSEERLKASECAAMAKLITAEFNGALADYASILAERGIEKKPAFHYNFRGWAADPDFWFILTDSLMLDPNLTSTLITQLATEVHRDEGSEFNYPWGKLLSTRRGVEVIPAHMPAPPKSDIEVVE
ncbi:MAG: hypothetical protein KDI66_05895 [Xanthomonadales bacterium]|nr:hypothetical protein [Xanthomonadales bacterium]